ncbi:MAG: histone deacetylase [Proteobacteria bacterium]|nr:histone deacetylase [Pseudomonadota bacterium]
MEQLQTNGKMPIGFHQLYCDGLSPKTKFPRERYPKLKEEMLRRGSEQSVHWFSPRYATFKEITQVHEPGYVQRFLTENLSASEKRKIGLRPWTKDIVERTLRLTGGTIQAVQYAIQSNGYAGNLAGGTHHAYGEYGSGYCIFNDIVVAAIAAIDMGCGRISIVDLDVHQGDGTAHLCSGISNIQTISVHCEQNFPFQKQNSDLDIALPESCEDLQYLHAVEQAIMAVEDFNPDLLIFQGGVDPLAEDRLGRMNISRLGLQERNRQIFDLADKHELPCLVLMGGGYAKPIEPTVDCLADMFLVAAERHKKRLKSSALIS